MIDQKEFGTSGQITPAAFAEAITPADNDLASTFSRAIYVGSGGDLVVTMAGARDVPVTFKSVLSGSLLPLRVAQVNAATTCSDIVVLF